MQSLYGEFSCYCGGEKIAGLLLFLFVCFCYCLKVVSEPLKFFFSFLPWLFRKIYKDQLNSMTRNMSIIFILIKPEDLDLRQYMLSNVPSSPCDEVFPITGIGLTLPCFLFSGRTLLCKLPPIIPLFATSSKYLSTLPFSRLLCSFWIYTHILMNSEFHHNHITANWQNIYVKQAI